MVKTFKIYSRSKFQGYVTVLLAIILCGFFLCQFEKHYLTSFLKKLFIYLFMAALGLCCCEQAFSTCGEWGLLFIAVHGLLIAVASLVAEHGL